MCATLDALLRARGLRVGRYTSPHLVDFKERVLVNGVPIHPTFVVEFIERWTPTVERIGATFFEATTAMAFAWFDESNVDVAVLETGLGGRLDSTNVVRPLVAGVTSIGIDHTEFLGNTREEIAYEKAGIFKAGIPAVIGERDREIAGLLSRMAIERRASEVRLVWEDYAPTDIEVDQHGTHFTLPAPSGSLRITTPLAGAHQASNTAMAILMSDVAGVPYATAGEAVNEALSTVALPGRFQRVGQFIFDVAHNPDGARVLAETIAAVRPPRPLVVVLTVLADKDWRGIMRALAPVSDLFALTNAPTAPASRAWDSSAALAFAKEQGWAAVLETDFDRALDHASRSGASVVITGSFHTVGDAMTRLQVDPLAR